MELRKRYIGGWDGASVAVSLVCLVHCVALPLLVSVLPLWQIPALEDPRLEWLTLLLTAIIGGWAILKGYRHHRQKPVAFVFLTGLGLVAVASFLPSFELVLKGAGATLVIWAHLRNWSHTCRTCAVHQRSSS